MANEGTLDRETYKYVLAPEPRPQNILAYLGAGNFTPRPKVSKVLNKDVEQDLINTSIEITNNTSEQEKRRVVEKELAGVSGKGAKNIQKFLADNGKRCYNTIL